MIFIYVSRSLEKFKSFPLSLRHRRFRLDPRCIWSQQVHLVDWGMHLCGEAWEVFFGGVDLREGKLVGQDILSKKEGQPCDRKDHKLLQLK